MCLMMVVSTHIYTHWHNLIDIHTLQVFSSVPAAGGFTEALGTAFAPHWNGTYIEDKTAVWIKPGPRYVPVPAQGVGNVEDPYTWIDQRGHHHIIAHSQV
jgi:hypothetical protein